MKSMSKATEKKLAALAEKYIPSLEGRGDLKERMNDEDDFFEASVWGLEALLKAAYEFGRESK